MSSGSADEHKTQLPHRPFDPILTNALRYTISIDEYEKLHKFLASRAPIVRKRALPPQKFESDVSGTSDHTVATIRASFRLLIVTYGGLKAWESISYRLAERLEAHRGRKPISSTLTNPPASSSSHPNLRFAASLSLILFFHRLLRRFLLRLRASLQEEAASGFRRRNPNVTSALTWKYTPSVGAALAGICLGASPKSQFRITTAIYALTRAAEFAYTAADRRRLIWGRDGKPSWVGSWMFVPFAYGQLLHAFVFDRDCFPGGFGDFILGRSPGYIQQRPTGLQAGTPWPTTVEIVDGLAGLSRLNWPSLGVAASAGVPAVQRIQPIMRTASPLIHKTSCAVLHPDDPSCIRAQLKYFLSAFPQTTRFFTLIYGALSLFTLRTLLRHPLASLNKLAARILRVSLFVTGAIGTSWGSICLLSTYLPNNFLATQRWFLGGFLGGLWAFCARETEKGNFLYSVRLSIDSLYKVGVKRGWWKGIRNGDVLLFAASLALINAVYDSEPSAVKGSVVRKSLGVLRGEGWIDRVVRHEHVSSTDTMGATPDAQVGQAKKGL